LKLSQKETTVIERQSEEFKRIEREFDFVTAVAFLFERLSVTFFRKLSWKELISLIDSSTIQVWSKELDTEIKRKVVTEMERRPVRSLSLLKEIASYVADTVLERHLKKLLPKIKTLEEILLLNMHYRLKPFLFLEEVKESIKSCDGTFEQWRKAYHIWSNNEGLQSFIVAKLDELGTFDDWAEYYTRYSSHNPKGEYLNAHTRDQVLRLASCPEHWLLLCPMSNERIDGKVLAGADKAQEKIVSWTQDPTRTFSEVHALWQLYEKSNSLLKNEVGTTIRGQLINLAKTPEEYASVDTEMLWESKALCVTFEQLLLLYANKGEHKDKLPDLLTQMRQTGTPDEWKRFLWSLHESYDELIPIAFEEIRAVIEQRFQE
jgi:hypothetical protein